MDLITLQGKDLIARINPENQQLVSLEYEGQEFMHGGGNPDSARPEDKTGWPNSELIMFPVVGPVEGNGVVVPVGNLRAGVPMTQHGLARYLPFQEVGRQPTYVRHLMTYQKSTPVMNPKTGGELFWPFSFTIDRLYQMTEFGLEARFIIENNSAERMPYEFGWHPAFKTFEARGQNPGKLIYYESQQGTKHSLERRLTVDDLQAKGKAVKYDGHSCVYSNGPWCINICESVSHPRSIEHMMLWSPQGSGLVCMEPVTRLPDGSHFKTPGDVLAPYSSKTYKFVLQPYHYTENRKE